MKPASLILASLTVFFAFVGVAHAEAPLSRSDFDLLVQVDKKLDEVLRRLESIEAKLASQAPPKPVIEPSPTKPAEPRESLVLNTMVPPTAKPSYERLYAESVLSGTPLFVWVNCEKPEFDKGELLTKDFDPITRGLHYSSSRFDGSSAPALVVGVPIGDTFHRIDLPHDAAFYTIVNAIELLRNPPPVLTQSFSQQAGTVCRT